MSLLELRRTHYCPLSFDFKEQSLEVVDYKGQPWFTAETIGKALGYANPREAIFKIFDRNKKDFGDDETTVIEIEVEVNSEESHTQNGYGIMDKNTESHPQDGGGIIGKQRAHTRKQKVRIFSLRGSYHFGFFAKTELGRDYRQWVLDLIENRHEESSYHSVFLEVAGVLCEKYPLWLPVHDKFTLGTPIVVIAKELDISVGRASRAIQQMRRYKVLTEQEYQHNRAEGRKYLQILRKDYKERGLS